MKKCSLTLITIFYSMAICRQLDAQTNSTYVYFNPTYAFPGNATKLNEDSINVRGITYSKGLYGSYARGLSLQAGIGKMINDNIGVELAADWINSTKIQSDYSNDGLSNVPKIYFSTSEKISSLLVKPMLVLRNSGDLLSFYSKLGLAIAVFSKHYIDFSYSLKSTLSDPALQFNTVSKESYNAKVGFTAAFGISFQVSQFVALSLETNGQMLSLPVKKGHLTSYKINGEEYLSSLDINSNSWVYKKSVSTTAQDPNKPGTRLYNPANYSYIGIGIGLKYFF